MISVRFRSLALTMLLLAALPAGAATIEDSFEESWRVGPGGSLQLWNENGSVEVESWERDEVRVQATIRIRAGSRSGAEEALEEFRIETRRDGDSISVRARKPKGRDGIFAWFAGRDLNVDVRYTVTVPRRFDLDVTTVNGAIEGRGLAGHLVFDTVNGSIKVVRSRGAVSADTVNGSISVELLSVSGEDSMEFSTTNGRIEIALPRGVGADVDASTTNGKISTDIPLTTDSFSRSRIRGTLNGGGVPIKARTVNGSIRILEI